MIVGPAVWVKPPVKAHAGVEPLRVTLPVVLKVVAGVKAQPALNDMSPFVDVSLKALETVALALNEREPLLESARLLVVKGAEAAKVIVPLFVIAHSLFTERDASIAVVPLLVIWQLSAVSVEASVHEPPLALFTVTLLYVEEYGVKVCAAAAFSVKIMFTFKSTAPVFIRLAFVKVSVFVALVVRLSLVVTVNAPVKLTDEARLVALAKVVFALRVASLLILIPFVPFEVIVPASARVPKVDGSSRFPVTVKVSSAVFPRERVPVVVNEALAALVAVLPVPLLKEAFPALTVSAFVTERAPFAVKAPLPLTVKL